MSIRQEKRSSDLRESRLLVYSLLEREMQAQVRLIDETKKFVGTIPHIHKAVQADFETLVPCETRFLIFQTDNSMQQILVPASIPSSGSIPFAPNCHRIGPKIIAYIFAMRQVMAKHLMSEYLLSCGASGVSARPPQPTKESMDEIIVM
ncbi:predicted protein [Histoplasma capsulatum G186AR]|uniref:Uncharacterized protein n=1 Tax=Ajellomyces capsulatus (strain G186AR / H82 / ATCC MYA-2454 / RMSCC 2432) TaxID=447093 RepID=C0NAZ4_AJECG|nr:uncharacterized protein HCBG_00290 [Histoplasma capsulatum G186AR]EEH10835.1 predicted protein [Histoplasma capsulatum G186AR]